MRIPRPSLSPRRAAVALCLGAALTLPLTACGQERADSASNQGATPTPSSAPSPSSTHSPSPTRSPTPSPAGPRGNVEPVVPDGAPHYGENNGFKSELDMSPANERAARAEAARVEPVIARLWKAGVWDPDRVRAALLALGYRNQGAGGESGDGTLSVSGLGTGGETGQQATPEGARVALYVGDDACVTAYTQPASYHVGVGGMYAEGGCFKPTGGH
ncbi:hypothetical protein [Streptomyces buecherae]|uniref:Lipoprotein n=1 Tax=Streptomyces buecherae TaxID=2763006 RepID=A0A7H8NB12_9ACTN|nr:hypothetical protein [Streptomyces buecherae]QKW51614.1 hypothetical protein HUT08_21180 [Streptomyces buecherae]